MRVLPALVGLLLLAAPSGAQEVERSTVSGTLVSRSATIAEGETSADVFTVPSGTAFILTQACTAQTFSSNIPFRFPVTTVSLVGSELGVVPLPASCTSFEPGIAFGADERISCHVSFATSVDVSCVVTGVLQPDRPEGRGPGSR